MRRAVPFLVAALALVAACAVVESPPGGPVDETPPRLAGFSPDSAAVVTGPLTRLAFDFSEKMNRTKAGGWLHLYPTRRIRKTSWKGAIRAEVELEEPLPPDTVVVVEVAAKMKDAHKVSGMIERRYPVFTGEVSAPGRISGSLVLADSALADAVVELLPVPPDTVAWDRQDILRRTRCDRDGRFELQWLPVPSGPYLLHAFADGDLNLRRGEKEPHRLLPDTVSLVPGRETVELGATTLYPLDTPGRLRLLTPDTLPPASRFGVIAMAITEADTGWDPAPAAFDSLTFSWLDSVLGDTLAAVTPGPNRLILFADLDRDSSFSVVPDSLVPGRGDTLLYVVADSAADTTGHYLEPWRDLEPVAIEPGLLQTYTLPPGRFTLTAWPEPEIPAPAVGDSTAAADSLTRAAVTPADSTAAPDSTGTAPPDSTGAAEPDTLGVAAPDTTTAPGE